MKKIFLKLSLLIAIGFVTAIFTSCENNNPYFNATATVLRMDMDCGHFEVKFDKKCPVAGQYIHLAINLPESYRKKGERISIEFRRPENEEMPICTTKGPGTTLPIIFVVRASKIN